MGWKVIAPLFMGRLPRGVHAPQQSDGPPRVYLFRDWQGAVVAAAAGEHVIQAFGSLAALNTYFGGHISFGRLFRSNEFLGVWGNRNASRFRRILRERVGELEIIHAKPPAYLKSGKITGRRLNAEERTALEKSFSPKL